MDMASIEASECVRNWLRTMFADAETSTPSVGNSQSVIVEDALDYYYLST
jgi:hypothetical protein